MRKIDLHGVLTRVINHYINRLIAYYHRSRRISTEEFIKTIYFNDSNWILNKFNDYPLLKEFLLIRESIWDKWLIYGDKVTLKLFERVMDELLSFILMMRDSDSVCEEERVYWLETMREMLEELTKYILRNCFEKDERKKQIMLDLDSFGIREKKPYMVLKAFLEDECVGYFLTDSEGKFRVWMPRGKYVISLK